MIPAMTPLRRLAISDNRRFLTTADGAPFFWLADTAWELFHRLTLDEIAQYLGNRRQKGFNVIQAVALAELDGLRVPTPDGLLPFDDLDPARPNPAYFDRIETVIRLAADNGLYIALLPTWGDKVNQGRWDKGPQIFTVETARAYGQFIGARYRDHDNIVWVNGGDRYEVEDGVDYRPVFHALGEGIRAEAAQLMTYHPRGVGASSEFFHDAPWLDFNMWQSGHSDIDEPIWDYISADTARQPAKPVLDGEPCYEDIAIQFNPLNGDFTPYDVRRRAYRSVFAGGCGFTYGHASVWQMYAPGRESVLGAHIPWPEALDRIGAGQMLHLRQLMESLPYLTRVPDQSLILSDAGTGSAHLRAARDSDGTYALVYFPKPNLTAQIDLSRLRGATARATWFDPRTGERKIIGEYPTNAPATFATGSYAGADWVLVLEAVA
jgi:hypothetical protein